jgi:hypothetical protein
LKRIKSSESLAEIGHYKNVLEQNGIHCLIKNEQLSGALGEVPFLECLPELWVLNEKDSERAERLIAELSADVTGGKSWHCSHCDQENESQFAACWNCGEAGNED